MVSVDDGEKSVTVGSRRVSLDHVGETLRVELSELGLDELQIDLRASDEHTDQVVVTSAESLHGSVKLLSEKLLLVRSGTNDSQVRLLEISRELLLNALLDGSTSELLEVGEHLAELVLVLGGKNVKERFTYILSQSIVGIVGSVFGSSDQANKQVTELSRSVSSDVGLKGLSELLLVGDTDSTKLIDGSRAENLNENSLIGSQSLHGGLQLLDVVVQWSFHQSEDSLLQISRELFVERGDDVLAVFELVWLAEKLPLSVGDRGEHLDDGVLVSGAESAVDLLSEDWSVELLVVDDGCVWGSHSERNELINLRFEEHDERKYGN
ncbi:hypothetical protein GCK72_008486 [Caenorhabditis remanei]|uniref:Uncharacterized protein n=1 Tax=Caenorhabditis remanei TaxID=31234 RepID=A0A6A5GXQ3_CAERE|nr:hypothetical protein GCK72_008486 [Caenorhabditis remanei]KAF1760240.1 hypothetical protein GCK72_008486 [Caenorhabditis remanei]